MNKFDDAFEKGHCIEFDAYRFDEPDYDALQVTEENFLEMLRVQAAGIAYYGTLAKKTEAEYDEMERRYRARYAEMYDTCAATIRKTGQRDSQKSIESLMWTKHEKELEEWNEKLGELRSKRDATASYYEGWKAKGFALSSMKDLVTAGLIRISTSITEDDVEKMNQRRMNVSQAGDILSNHRRLMGN